MGKSEKNRHSALDKLVGTIQCSWVCTTVQDKAVCFHSLRYTLSLTLLSIDRTAADRAFFQYVKTFRFYFNPFLVVFEILSQETMVLLDFLQTPKCRCIEWAHSSFWENTWNVIDLTLFKWQRSQIHLVADVINMLCVDLRERDAQLTSRGAYSCTKKCGVSSFYQLTVCKPWDNATCKRITLSSFQNIIHDSNETTSPIFHP